MGGSILFADVAPSRRHIRQRYGFLSLDRIERLVRAIIIIRATELTHLRSRPRSRAVRNAAAHGFRRRTSRAAWMRTIVGSRLRKALKHRDPAQRIQRLLAALANIDAFARRYLAPRAKRRLTRLFPILMSAPLAAPLVSRLMREPCASNTSQRLARSPFGPAARVLSTARPRRLRTRLPREAFVFPQKNPSLPHP